MGCQYINVKSKVNDLKMDMSMLVTRLFSSYSIELFFVVGMCFDSSTFDTILRITNFSDHKSVSLCFTGEFKWVR